MNLQYTSSPYLGANFFLSVLILENMPLNHSICLPLGSGVHMFKYNGIEFGAWLLTLRSQFFSKMFAFRRSRKPPSASSF